MQEMANHFVIHGSPFTFMLCA